MIALFKKNLSSLVPANADGEELLKKVKLGAEVLVEFRQPRNLPWLKKYWVLCQMIADNLDGQFTKESIDTALRLGVHHTRCLRMSGVEYEIPEPINFGSMKQPEWEKFWELVVAFTCEKIIPGIDNNAVEYEIHKLIA